MPPTKPIKGRGAQVRIKCDPDECTNREVVESGKSVSQVEDDKRLIASVKCEDDVKPPDNWLTMIENIRKLRHKFPAPVDTMGCDQALHQNDKDFDKRFQILVSLMLSSQTKDPITWAATQKLKEKNLCNAKGLLKVSEKDIEDLIYPVGFYRRKAIYLKKVAAILDRDYDGDLPASVKDLCKLPGVGPKMAHLCMQEAWGVVEGIGVDTHVHRIAARLAWVPSRGIKTPEDTRKALEKWLPREYWREINHLLVGFGQTICCPVRPKCHECTNINICPAQNQKRKSPETKVEKKPVKKKVKKSNDKSDHNNNVTIKKEPVYH